MKKLKKRLNDEQLEKVNGGFGYQFYGTYDYSDYYGEVDKYHVIVGQTYYIVDDYAKWFQGICKWSGEVNCPTCCTTQRHHEYEVVDGGTMYGSDNNGKIVDINGDTHRFFLHKY